MRFSYTAGGSDVSNSFVTWKFQSKWNPYSRPGIMQTIVQGQQQGPLISRAPPQQIFLHAGGAMPRDTWNS